MNKCTFYECNKCKQPYFGGIADCERNEMIEQNTKKEDLICYTCMRSKTVGDIYGQTWCQKHGDKFITWKCNRCCREALYHCGGTNYFCEFCHDGIDRPLNRKPGAPEPPALK